MMDASDDADKGQHAVLEARIGASVHTSIVMFAWAVAANVATATCLPVDSLLMITYKVSADSAAKATAAFHLLPVLLWFLWDGTRHRATYGMRKAGLGFQRTDGDTPGWALCLVRLTLGVLTLPVLPLSWIAALISHRGQTIPDLVCGTVVKERGVWASAQPGAFPVVTKEGRPETEA